MKKQEKKIAAPIYITIRNLKEKYPFLTEQGIRSLIRQNEDFRNRCVRRFGFKILIHEARLLEFIDESFVEYDDDYFLTKKDKKKKHDIYTIQEVENKELTKS